MTKPTKPLPRTINYDDLDGKTQTYHLEREESFTFSRCPIDGRPLYETDEDNGRCDGGTVTVYSCPCCNQTYHSLDPKRLQHSKEIILESFAEKLAQLKQQASFLEKVLACAQRSPKSTNPEELGLLAFGDATLRE